MSVSQSCQPGHQISCPSVSLLSSRQRSGQAGEGTGLTNDDGEEKEERERREEREGGGDEKYLRTKSVHSDLSLSPGNGVQLQIFDEFLGNNI